MFDDQNKSSSQNAADFQRVMIAVDGSKASTDALHVGADMAKRFGAAIAVVHVLDLARDFTPERGFLDDGLFESLRTAGMKVLNSLPQF